MTTQHSTSSDLVASSETESHLDWWEGLEDQWKKAFNEAIWEKGPVLDSPDAEELEGLFSAKALRFMGPEGSYPNMSFELTNLSGLQHLTSVEILVVCFQNVSSILEVSNMSALQSLFLISNGMHNLHGIERLKNLRELYAQDNQIDSLLPIKKLYSLEKIYISQNKISSLKGLTKKHVRCLKEFYCLPNDNLPNSEVLRVEQELRIRCLKG